jgi:hypothetical protein
MMKMIDGFVLSRVSLDDSVSNRVVRYKDGKFDIGCFNVTYEEAAEAIKKKYNAGDAIKYIQDLHKAMDMNWLTDAIHKELSYDDDSEVRRVIAEYSDRYHHILKDDDDWYVRCAVARYSDKYHEQFKDDKDWNVKCVVVKYSDKYHYYLKDDKDWRVVLEVAKCSDRYHNQLKNHRDPEVRKAVEEYERQRIV